MNKEDVVCPRLPEQSGRHIVLEIKLESLSFLGSKKIKELKQDISLKTYKCSCGLIFRIAADGKIIIMQKFETR